MSKKRFSKILIANRGEIAVRIIRTARKLGYETIAIFSEADANALHVQSADQAVSIQGNAPKDSYLCIDKIIEACRKSGAEAVHPGYGFLSENEEFAQACIDAGLVFIGPTPAAIKAMGNKSQAKALMSKSSVPCIPGYFGKEQDITFLLNKGVEIGFPLMVKAAAGGGGRGLRLVSNREALKEALISAADEALRAFGSAELLLEKALMQARHVEVQIFGDEHGNVIHLGERDCSIQRRHQKVIEESPSPAISAPLRRKMGEAAVRAGQAINYTGAGTVEFLLDVDESFYFLEMNTRLQVEHPVTEFITGLDLVEWQLLVASGHPLPLKQDEVAFSGHAIEARLYAEDPDSDFVPQIGPILYFSPPAEALARTDHGLKEVDQVSPYYDSMLGKIIVEGSDRESARRALSTALANTTLLGIKTNREFLRYCLDHEEFMQCRTDTGFIKRVWHPEQCIGTPDKTMVALAAAILMLPTASDDLAGWSSNGQMKSLMKLAIDSAVPVDVTVRYQRGRCLSIEWNDQSCAVSFSLPRSLTTHGCYQVDVTVDGLRMPVAFTQHNETIHVSLPAFGFTFSDLTYQPKKAAVSVLDGDVVSPSNGLVVGIQVTEGQQVEKGQALCTVEAMKLLQNIPAPLGGTVQAVLVKDGQQVKAKQLLVQITRADKTDTQDFSTTNTTIASTPGALAEV